LSDDSDKVFEDFGELMKTVKTVSKKSKGKGAPKKRIVQQDMTSHFSVQFGK